MKRRAFIATAVVVSLGMCQAFADWLPKEIHEVRAYAYDYTQEDQPTLLKNGKLHKGVINPEGAKLTPEQTSSLLAALSGKVKSDQPSAACYMPHHGFVFYDKEGKPMGHVELCFHCGNGYTYPEEGVAKSDRWDWGAMREILTELKVPVLDHKAEDKDYTKLFEAAREEEKKRDGK